VPEQIRQDWIGTRWHVEITAAGGNDLKLCHATHILLTSLRATPDALLLLVRDCWSMGAGGHWIHAIQRQEDAHRDRGHGDGAMDPLHTAGWQVLSLDGVLLTRAGMQAVVLHLKVLLAMACRQPDSNPW
jgi:hypothetical protein